MVNSNTVPLRKASSAEIPAGMLCVGPMTKFPSACAGGFVPSGSSFAVTYPGVFGSRVGGVGRSEDNAEPGMEQEIRSTAVVLATNLMVIEGANEIMSSELMPLPSFNAELGFAGNVRQRHMQRVLFEIIGGLQGI